MFNWTGYKKDNLSKDIRIVLAIIFSTLVFLCFDVVAYMASQQGVNNAYYFATLLDHAIKFSNLWVIFYELAFVVPFFVLAYIRYKVGPSIAVFQCVVLAFVVLLLISYIIFLLFPTSVVAILGVPKVPGDGFLNKWVLMTYKTIQPWNCMPSVHVAMSWFFFRIFAHFCRNIWMRIIYLLWFFAMVLATLTLKVHVILDLLVGFILADLVFQGVFSKLSPKKVEEFDQRFSVKAEIYFVLSVITVLAIGFYLFVHFYGLHGVIQ